MNRFTYEKGNAVLKKPENFDLYQIFECGQAFRFNPVKTDGEICYEGVAFGKYLKIGQNDGSVILYGASAEDCEALWQSYFDLDRDYTAVIEAITDPHARECAELGQGIRILRQDPWEALCSFIVSQNNNIPRIKKIIETMCRRFGEPIDGEHYAFPTAESLYRAGQDEIFACGTGFRAKYIYDCASRIVNGDTVLSELEKLGFDELCAELMKIKGVGPKVASCAGLFGFGKLESFPVDVWIKRVLDKYYPEDFDVKIFGESAGIIQQYLFYYERNLL